MSNNNQTKVTLWNIFSTFFKVGAFTFGGGYAMISVLQEELIVRKKWITDQDMMDMIVIAESTPGVIAVNTATSVGYKLRGVLGAIIATLGVVLPSFLIISLLSLVLKQVSDNPWYKAAFTGVQACVSVLIVNAFVKMSKQIKYDWFSVVMLISAAMLAIFTDVNVIFLIIGGGVFGLIYSYLYRKSRAKKGLSDEGPQGLEATQNAKALFVRSAEVQPDTTADGESASGTTELTDSASEADVVSNDGTADSANCDISKGEEE